MRILTRREWQILYQRWRVPYAHLPAAARGRIVRGCRGKALFETKEEANSMIEVLPPREGLQLSIYQCDICLGFWHIGNTAGKPGRRNGLVR